MQKIENYYEMSFTDLAMIYYKKFYKVFPVTNLKNMENKLLKKKLVDCIINGQVFNYNIEKYSMKENNQINYIKMINLVKESMDQTNYNYNKMINKINNIIDLRKNGKIFSFEEHLEALLLAQLSNHRWGSETIQKNQGKLREIFKNYDRDYLKEINPDFLTNNIIAISCGNASIYRQMRALSYNISVLEKIEKDYGSLDCFVSSDDPNTLANVLYDGKYKLRQIGKAFAFDYLKKIGINTCKSDSQIGRLFGNSRLNFVKKNQATAHEIVSMIKLISKSTSISEIEIDAILWQFCLPKGANICTELPNCNFCKLKDICNYNR